MTFRASRFTLALGIAAAMAAAAGCSGSSTTPTPQPVLATDPFNGVLPPGGTKSHNFVVTYPSGSDASITVTSLTTVANNSPVNITVGVGFGTTNLGVCTLSTIQNPQAPLNTELATTGAPFVAGTYCVQIFDNSSAPTVTEPINYAITVKHF